ncbi:MAG: response regulator [Alphaproteobacteria bacterium]|nr:response regulator [Alphaproteobacteria bacterium]MBV9376718.1 response regulator [Alphaproteobacteria bacterium]
MTAELKGARVLVVEDEFLVASVIEDMLESAGCVVSGPMPRVADALKAMDHESYDAAILDVNLAGDRVDAVAEALSRRNVPFMFVTGYAAGSLPVGFAERPRLSKPFKLADLLDTLSSIVKTPLPRSAPLE